MTRRRRKAELVTALSPRFNRAAESPRTWCGGSIRGSPITRKALLCGVIFAGSAGPQGPATISMSAG